MAFCYILPKIVVVFASQPDFESIQGYKKPKKGEFLEFLTLVLEEPTGLELIV